MSGVRALTREEVMRCASLFAGRYALRNRALFLLQYYTGRRISQLLALRIGDVVTENGEMVEDIYFKRRDVKGKLQGESVDFHPDARGPVADWLEHARELGYFLRHEKLFPAAGGRRLTRHAVFEIYDNAFRKAGLHGRLGTHSLRKAFGQRMHPELKFDVNKTARALGQTSLSWTQRYLDEAKDEIRAAGRKVL